MTFRSASSRVDPIIFNVTSLVDVLMVLIVFLLLSWSTAQIESDIGIKLPSASSGAPRHSASPVVINVRTGGAITVNQKQIDDSALVALLKKLAQLNPNQLAVVRADRQVPYERMLQVLDLCNEAGVKDIGFSAISAQGSGRSQ